MQNEIETVQWSPVKASDLSKAELEILLDMISFPSAFDQVFSGYNNL